MRDSFIFYKTFYDCIKELPKKVDTLFIMLFSNMYSMDANLN